MGELFLIWIGPVWCKTDLCELPWIALCAMPLPRVLPVLPFLALPLSLGFWTEPQVTWCMSLRGATWAKAVSKVVRCLGMGPSQWPACFHLLSICFPPLPYSVWNARFSHSDLGSLLGSGWPIFWPPKSVPDSIRWEVTTRSVSQWPLWLLGWQNGGKNGGKIGRCHHYYTLGVSIGTCLRGKPGLQSMPASYLQMMLLCVNCGSDWWGHSVWRNCSSCDCNNHHFAVRATGWDIGVQSKAPK